MSRIAFIGLGNMGGPMACNLSKAGHQVVGFDLDKKAREAMDWAIGAAKRTGLAAMTLRNVHHVARVEDGSQAVAAAELRLVVAGDRARLRDIRRRGPVQHRR